MQDLRHALAHFGQSLGLPDLALGVDGHARIRLGNGGAIGFEALDEELLVSRVAPAPFINHRQLLDALRLANAHQHPTPMPVAVGLTGHGNDASLVVSGRLGTSPLGATDIAQAIAHLTGWLTQWQATQT